MVLAPDATESALLVLVTTRFDSRMGSRSVAVHDALGSGAVLAQLPPPVTVAVFSASVSGEPVTVAVTL